MKKRPLILFGGGLDSCALVEQNRCFNPVLFYFDYGQKALPGEMRAMEYFAAKYRLDTEVIVVSALSRNTLASTLTAGEPSGKFQFKRTSMD